MPEQDIPTVEAMYKFGGAFVHSLAVAARYADPVNYQRLKEAFSEFWEKYSTFGQAGINANEH